MRSSIFCKLLEHQLELWLAIVQNISVFVPPSYCKRDQLLLSNLIQRSWANTQQKYLAYYFSFHASHILLFYFNKRNPLIYCYYTFAPRVSNNHSHPLLSDLKIDLTANINIHLIASVKRRQACLLVAALMLGNCLVSWNF